MKRAKQTESVIVISQPVYDQSLLEKLIEALAREDARADFIRRSNKKRGPRKRVLVPPTQKR